MFAESIAAAYHEATLPETTQEVYSRLEGIARDMTDLENIGVPRLKSLRDFFIELSLQVSRYQTKWRRLYYYEFLY